MRALVTGTALAIGVGLGATGCGSDTLTESEFTDEANAICAEGDAQLNNASVEYVQSWNLGPYDEPTLEQLQGLVDDVLVPEIEAQLDELRALDAPGDIQDELDAVLDEMQRVLDEFAQDPSAAVSGEDPFEAEVDPQLDELGLHQCSGI
jgi:hypothetical protein